MKILGLSWIVTDDQMSINVGLTSNSQAKLSKRIVLKLIASGFDPLGLFSPVILKGKIFLIELWNKKKKSWDVQLPLEIISRRNIIQQELQVL